MPTVNDIRANIAKDVEAEKGVKVATTTGAPLSGIGNVVSLLGTEKLVLDASNFQLMECEGRVKGNDKRRYCFVEKGTKASYNNQFVNSAGDRVYIIPRELFILLHGIFNSVLRQMRELDTNLKVATEQATLYKVTLDALRKHGIID